MDEQQSRQQKLIEALQSPACYPHAVDRVEHVETHISHLLLAGDCVYKIKKPLDLGFLDFSTLERRRFYCEEELRLNTRLAPQIYEAVVAIGGSADAPVFDGGGDAFEYAVRMKRFDREQELDKLLERGELPRAWMQDLAGIVAGFHERIPRAAPDSNLGTPEAVLQPMQENFDQLGELIEDHEQRRLLDTLEQWTLDSYRQLKGILSERHEQGFIRECHGDMHLGNMTRFEDRLVIFDGIEFSEALRWNDIISEVAFVTMDLADRGAPGHAWAFLNTWLEYTGDYAGVRLLRFYEIYRAMVRAKIAGIRLAQSLPADERQRCLQECEGYLALARHLTRYGGGALLINHGFSGSGKTTRSREIVEQLGAIRIRTDVERKRLAGMKPHERGDSQVGEGIYSSGMSERTYSRLSELAELLIRAGYPVIVDGAFLGRRRRDEFRDIAGRLQVPCVILDYQAPGDVLRERVRERAEREDDASDAGLQVLEHQLETAGPLQSDEPVVAIEHDQPLPLETIAARLEHP